MRCRSFSWIRAAYAGSISCNFRCSAGEPSMRHVSVSRARMSSGTGGISTIPSKKARRYSPSDKQRECRALNMGQCLFPPSPGGKTDIRFQKTVEPMRARGLFFLRRLSRNERKGFKNLTRIRIDDLAFKMLGKAQCDRGLSNPRRADETDDARLRHLSASPSSEASNACNRASSESSGTGGKETGSISPCVNPKRSRRQPST